MRMGDGGWGMGDGGWGMGDREWGMALKMTRWRSDKLIKWTLLMTCLSIELAYLALH